MKRLDCIGKGFSSYISIWNVNIDHHGDEDFIQCIRDLNLKHFIVVR